MLMEKVSTEGDESWLFLCRDLLHCDAETLPPGNALDSVSIGRALLLI
jgi:hypothetical protein